MKSSHDPSILMLAFICCCVGRSSAQFELSAEIRPRTEYRNGFKTPRSEGQEAALFTEQRSRIYLHHRESKYILRFALQDVRIWGESAQILKQEDGNTFISEAWGEYFLSPEFSLKAGRQIISYDNQRFFGGLEWAQQGRRHDAFLLKFHNPEKKTKLDLGFALNADDDIAEPAYIQSAGASFYSVTNDYKNFQYAWFHRDFDRGSLSLLALNAGYQNPDSTISYKQTLGAVLRKDFGHLSLAGDFYHQGGSLTGKKVNAFLTGVNLTWQTKITPITAGFEWISGKDDDDTNPDIRSFSPDFGTNHIHNGLMDYFFVGPSNGNTGVTDIYLKTKFKLSQGDLLFDIHEFLTGSNQFDSEGTRLTKAMGTEFDLVYSTTLSPQVNLDLGYSHLLATSTMKTLRDANKASNHWAWVMLTFKPVLFKTEKE
jgi:hypothetical protein